MRVTCRGGDLSFYWTDFNATRSIFAFSKRKLCNGENFRIKDFDEFRCF